MQNGDEAPKRNGRRPRIGITSYWARASMTSWTLDAVLVGQGYVEGVRGAGGLPLVLPADPTWAQRPEEIVDELDGLVLSGGNDIDPALYGQPPHPRTRPPHPRRDSVELGLLRRALERDIPVLGICRGIQLLNVALGGTLVQHLGDTVDLRPHREDDATFGEHPVATTPGTRLAAVVGPQSRVLSHHHQGIAELGEGLVASAHAPDGVVEGIEDPARAFCVGVLWHPDADCEGEGAALFRALVEAAAPVSSPA